MWARCSEGHVSADGWKSGNWSVRGGRGMMGKSKMKMGKVVKAKREDQDFGFAKRGR